MHNPSPASGSDEVRFRAVSLTKALDEYEELFPPPRGEPDVYARGRRLRIAELQEGIVLQANHLRKALEASEVGVDFSVDLADRVRHLRNLYEHWDQHRDSFGNAALPKDRSGQWYAERFPDRTPWSASWSNNEGYMLGGVLNLAELRDVLEQVQQANDS